ncbi:hypothetical protein [Aliidongia dinghuensis]|uniref:hypothetical protein n=1 Tax=Aliidongia dinghuensis TaxID=1867774 RepID=UPI0016648C8F|nr:hypothetical protein [Aliidongia dinghuensis]
MVYLPTWAKTVDGVYLAQEPLAVVSVRDTPELELAFKEKFLHGNPRIPRPDFRALKPIFETHAGVKSWSSFERGAASWSVTERDGIYEICIGRRCRNGGWEDDHERKVIFPPGTTLDEACRRIVEIIQAEAGAIRPRSIHPGS